MWNKREKALENAHKIINGYSDIVEACTTYESFNTIQRAVYPNHLPLYKDPISKCRQSNKLSMKQYHERKVKQVKELL